MPSLSPGGQLESTGLTLSVTGSSDLQRRQPRITPSCAEGKFKNSHVAGKSSF